MVTRVVLVGNGRFGNIWYRGRGTDLETMSVLAASKEDVVEGLGESNDVVRELGDRIVSRH